MTVRARVVIVDDVRGLRSLLRIILEGSGLYEVVGEGADGREGVALAHEHRPDIVLLDLSMPGMDGLEALPQILRVSPGTKVAILSGLREERLVRQALAAGAVDFILKGASPSEIVERLQAIAPGAGRAPAWRGPV